MKKELLIIESSSYKTTIYDDKTIIITSKDGLNSTSVSFTDERDLEEWFKRQMNGWLGSIMWAVSQRKEE
jgi:hypothetical protein